MRFWSARSPALITVALRAQRDAARAHLQQLTRDILTGAGGPAEQAAAARIAEMRARHHQQRDPQHAVAHARADWITADAATETHHHLLDQLDKDAAAATARGEHQLADTYQRRRTQLSQHTAALNAAATEAQQRHHSTYTALIEVAGGADRIVTEHDITPARLVAMRADTDTLNAARAAAIDLDNHLARAEAAAAREFAQRAGHTYDLATDLAALHAEIDFLDTAGATSFDVEYLTGPEVQHTYDHLDEPARTAIADVLHNGHVVQLIHLHPDADKPAVLAALSGAVTVTNNRALALPASADAAEYRTTHRYADPLTTGDRLRDLPPGSLLIVDDADHLTTRQLHDLAANAARTNTKLLLITGDSPGASRELLTAAHNDLPWAHQLGTPTPAYQQPATAIHRAETHLSSTEGHSPARQTATTLLARRDELHRRYTTDAA
jgi:hypothetical protein